MAYGGAGAHILAGNLAARMTHPALAKRPRRPILIPFDQHALLTSPETRGSPTQRMNLGWGECRPTVRCRWHRRRQAVVEFEQPPLSVITGNTCAARAADERWRRVGPLKVLEQSAEIALA